MLSFTVITVCYNSAATIVDTLHSVAQQTYPHVEHIIIDGGSTDATVALARAHGRAGMVVVSEPDKGIYDAMNKGLRRATGDVVAFLNADDFYAHHNVLTEVARLFDAENLDAVLADAAFFHPNNPQKMVRRYRSDRFTPQRLAWGWMPAHPGLFLRRDVLKQVGEFKTHYRIAGDFELIARIFSDNTRVYRHLPQIVVRMRTGGVSTGGLRSTILLNREVMRACRENGIATNWFKILSKYPLKLLEFL
jgi:glycosyltransferase involved in cell wall biosynthesis